jgi:tetratricopeptide (TPR) repeat protein
MKLIEGRSLAEILDTEHRAQSQLLQVILKTCETIAFVHSQGVVHGDLKPHNIMVGRYGEVQVMDWGFAFRSSERSEAPQSRAGTPAYMAPEQASAGHRIDERSDVYGLGAILFQTLTGEAPHTGGGISPVSIKLGAAGTTKEEALERILRRRLSEAKVEERLAQITLRCLAHDPAERPQDAGTLQVELQEYLDGLEQHARDMELRAAAAQASLEHSRRARRFATLSFVTILLAILTVGALLYTAERRSRDERAKLAERVAQASSEAEALRALALDQHSLRRWRDAVAAAERAVALAETSPGDPAMRSRARQLRDELRRERESAQRIAQLSERLENIVPHLGDERDVDRLERDFAAAFGSIGIQDGTRPESKQLSELRNQGQLPELLHAFDSWILLRHKHGIPSAEAWKLPFDFAQALDPDPKHRQLRAAYTRKDLATLRKLASDERIPQLDPELLEFLGRCLFELGDRERARVVFERAHLLHPGNSHISHNLAIMLDRTDPDELRESIRLLSMALAVEPDDDHLHTDLALYFLEVKELERALATIQRSLELNAESARAHYVMALTQQFLGNVSAMQRYYRGAHELGHRHAAMSLAIHKLQRFRYHEARPLLLAASQRNPRDRQIQLETARVLIELEDFEGGLARMDRICATWPKWAEAHAQRAAAHASTLDWDSAFAGYDRALLLSKSEEQLQRYASWRQMTEARKAAFDSIVGFADSEELPTRSEQLARLITLCVRRGEYDRAAEAFEASADPSQIPLAQRLDGIRALAELAHRESGQGAKARWERAHMELAMLLAEIGEQLRIQQVERFGARILFERILGWSAAQRPASLPADAPKQGLDQVIRSFLAQLPEGL